MKVHPKIVDRIVEAIKGSETICVAGHVRPDGDCIGSQLGLTLALTNAGKKVTCWNQDPVPAKLQFLDPKNMIQPPEKGRHFDCVIATDCASLERLGTVADCINERKIFINIDHHASNTRYGDLNWIAAREPATDTGSFQYPTTRPSTYHVAGELVKRGANLARICDEVYQSYPLGRVRLLRHVYNKFRLTHNNQIAYFWLKKSDYSRTGTDPSDSEGLIDHIRAIEPVVVACVFEEVEPQLTRISLRSKNSRIDVNKIAQQFNGGGHAAAAGARIAGTPLSVQRKVVAAIKKSLNGLGKHADL